MILLDTNILSELMRLSPNNKVIDTIDKLPIESTYISAITHAEILQGIALLPKGKRKQNLAKMADEILTLFAEKTLAFDKHASPFYADIIRQQHQKGRPIDFPDAQIAAIALQYNLQLVTRNIKDFENIAGLQLINPWE
jgi:predicted nucleic acid-binding protein